jgi:SAM-dependent methyltransferase
MNAYISGTSPEVTRFKTWLDRTLALLSKNARIFEIGSGFGRDARYIESKGFTVQRSDATKAFVHLLQQEGYSADLFNVLTEDFSATYDLIFANAVFLHFTPSEFQKVLDKIHASLSPNGILSFTVKQGIGEEWTSAKVGHPRYFCYWCIDALESLLESKGFTMIESAKDEKFLQIIARAK